MTTCTCQMHYLSAHSPTHGLGSSTGADSRLVSLHPSKPRAKSSFPSRDLCTFRLHALQNMAVAAAERSRTKQSMLSQSMLSHAGTLYAVITRSRTLAAAAASKGSASLMTELMTARLALMTSRSLTATGRAAGDGSSAKVANHLFTVLPPCYKLVVFMVRECSPLSHLALITLSVTVRSV